MKRGGGREGGVGCVVGEMECSVPKGGSGWRVWMVGCGTSTNVLCMVSYDIINDVITQS